MDGTDVAAVRDAEASAWLDAPPELASSARSVSEKIFALAVRYVPKTTLRRLLTQGFDAEQIWQQIEIQDKPLLSSVRRQIKELEKVGGDFFGLGNNVVEEGKEDGDFASEGSSSGEEEDDGEEDGDGEEEEEEEEEEEGDDGNVLDDKFLKIKDMDKFLIDAEEEYQHRDDVGNEDEDDDDDEDEEDEDGDDDDKEIRYEDFFSKIKKKKPQRKDGENPKHDEAEDVEMRDEEDDDNDDIADEQDEDHDLEHNQEKEERKSSHEKQLEKTRKRIEQLEKANMDTKDWTMRGEITAAKRPKNSALEADLDFEHNARPAPVITEEVTISLEDLIRQRVVEARFDDVERKQKLPDLPPAQKIEIDESKSKKGLGELYEEEYMQSAGLSEAAETESDKLKKEARDVFKRLCIKLDALAHFHFAPKPVIEDMAVKNDIPALAMEEVAPVFVSDASMLAPEELFSGKGAIKDEKELDKTDRKRRRAAKKRKFKARQKADDQTQPKRPRTGDDHNAKAAAAAPKAKQTSKFVKSAKVFADLDRQKSQTAAKEVRAPKPVQPSSFKL